MISPEYRQARAVLLDALEALGPHRDAVVLVGAQAVYLHTGDADLATAPATTDADLALVPDQLAAAPPIAAAMTAAGFVAGKQPGSWLGRGRIAVDLMAPEALCGSGGRRSAHLRPPHHATETARRTPGLEAAVVDNAVHVIRSFTRDDGRSFTIKVAGPAALVVAKVVKIAERRTQPGRLKPKDGLDVLRLLRAVDTPRLARDLRALSSNELAGAVVTRAVQDLRELAAEILPSLAAAAETGFDDPDVIRASMVVLVDDLLNAVY